MIRKPCRDKCGLEWFKKERSDCRSCCCCRNLWTTVFRSCLNSHVMFLASNAVPDEWLQQSRFLIKGDSQANVWMLDKCFSALRALVVICSTISQRLVKSNGSGVSFCSRWFFSPIYWFHSKVKPGGKIKLQLCYLVYQRAEARRGAAAWRIVLSVNFTLTQYIDFSSTEHILCSFVEPVVLVDLGRTGVNLDNDPPLASSSTLHYHHWWWRKLLTQPAPTLSPTGYFVYVTLSEASGVLSHRQTPKT